MATTYEPAPKEVTDLLADVVRQYHPDQKQAGVTYLVLLAHASKDEETGEPTGPALKHQGYPARALVKILPLKDRVAGLPDCRIELDGDEYRTWPEAELRAVLDHETTHIEVTGSTDDVGRPKLKLRKHDRQIGAFDEVIRRHEKAAAEAQALHEAFREVGPLFADW